MNTPSTQFWDMHSGGGTKEAPYEKIYIEAPEQEAKVIFYNRFGHNPERVSCTCCGEDYSITESPSLEEATAYHRGCDCVGVDKSTGEEVPKGGNTSNMEFRYLDRPRKEKYAGQYLSLDQYVAQPDVLVIRAEDIRPEERVGSVPEEGYIWR